ncbi:MAG: glycoside hydrolase family 32 protein [Leuconostoc pseudomesenteroides]|uniref:glycoside hydrolase family 32 protein n=1 Tax=Leuconostoc pseudomesenteroides TaxID=33968 RepID=UPI0039ED60D3
MLVKNDTISREEFHLYPTQGLLNDPNGLVYFKGKYHVFFQWNPKVCNHKYKEWGHFVSKDLITWERVETALKPSLAEDAAGIYSGTAFVKDNRLYVFYTGNVRDEAGHSVASHQMWAVSDDGLNFTKLGQLFPHPEGFTKDVRDPMVWQGQNGHFFMILGARPDNNIGDIIVYESTNFENWQFRGSLISGELTEVRGYMLECPDLIEVDGKQVLMFSPQGLAPDKINHRYENIHNTGYVVGHFDEKTAHFTPETSFEEVDRGFEFYAPQTLNAPDGRRIMWGWAGMMTPERESKVPTIAEDNWVHVLSLPRVLHVTDDNKLTQAPIAELVQPIFVKPEDVSGVGAYALHTQADWLINFGDDLTLSRQKNRLTMTRKQWESDQYESREVTGNLDEVLLVVDKDIIEVYTDNDQLTLTARYF